MKSKMLGLLGVGLLVGPMAANAVQMVFSADAVSPAVVDFTINFDDTGDGLLQFEEVTYFSGTSFNGVPLVSLFEVAQTAFSTGNPTYWGLTESGPDGWNVYILASRWSYSLATVPEPGTLALLGLGLAGLGLSRRRKAN